VKISHSRTFSSANEERKKRKRGKGTFAWNDTTEREGGKNNNRKKKKGKSGPGNENLPLKDCSTGGKG